MTLVAGRVPVALVEPVPIDAFQVGGVPIDRDDAGGEDHAAHGRSAAGGLENVAGAQRRGLDEVALGIFDIAHNEGRGSVKHQSATRHGAVEPVWIKQVGPKQRQRAGTAMRNGLEVAGLSRIARVPHGGMHIEAAFEQSLDQPGRDVAVRARDKDRSAEL